MDNLHRIEHDFLGEMQIEDDKYYGIQTLRAKENFNITTIGINLFPNFINSLAKVKKACALTNFELGDLTQSQKDAIVEACDRIIAGEFHDQFIVDPIQGGAGTSTNMNANEVITITLYELIFKLQDSLKILRDSFYGKAVEFKDILKMGRTQLQDAVPMTLGQEFKTYATMIDDDIFRLSRAQDMLKEVNLGATAIGTGINTKPEYQELVIKNLRIVTGTEYYKANDMIEATQDTGSFVQISGRFKSIAIKVSKICNDLRLLSSGPRAGLNEINLPPMQPGSSIMPGKVNPVMPEVVNQVAFDVIGADVTISMASEHGQLQLNVFEPIIAYKLFISINMMRRAFESLAEKCIKGITANPEVCMNNVLNSATLVTSLNPILGYEKSSAVAKEALRTGKRVYDILLEQKLFTKEELEELLQPKNMVHNYDKI